MQMVFAFFDSKGLVYTCIVPMGLTIDANYTVVALVKFLKYLTEEEACDGAAGVVLPLGHAPAKRHRCQDLAGCQSDSGAVTPAYLFA